MEASSESPHLGHWVKVIDHSASVLSNRELKEYGLTRSSWYIIYHIYEVGEIYQKDLQNALEVESGTMAMLVNNLVKNGWLIRKDDENDRRVKKLQLTPDGKERWEKVPDFIQVLRDKMMAGISKDEEAMAVSVLKKAWFNLKEELEKPKEIT